MDLNRDRIDLSKNTIKEDNINSVPTFSINTKSTEKPFETLKKQNKFLKWISCGLAACMILGVLGAVGVNSNESHYYVSDGIRGNNIGMISVKGNENILTASEIYSQNIDSVVAIRTEMVTTNIFGQRVSGASAGSGFIISEDGYILTNYHVIQNASDIQVTLHDGKTYNANVIGYEQDRDVAVIKIEDTVNLKPVLLGDSSKIEVGEPVVAIGNPLGELTFSVTEGIVSALDREISTDLYSGINMFQVDCAVNEGNSGGPIFNQYGEVIGIVSAKYASETIEGLGFCIPINDVSVIVEDLIEHGSIPNKAYMGISVEDMPFGIYVTNVVAESSADKAGIEIGDIILEVNGKKIDSSEKLRAEIREYRANDKATIKIWRNGEEKELNIVFDEVPEMTETSVEEVVPNDRYKEYNIPPELFEYFLP